MIFNKIEHVETVTIFREDIANHLVYTFVYVYSSKFMMEMGGVGSAYAGYMASQASDNRVSTLQNKLESGYQNATENELKQACKEFEAYFVEQMFKSMMETTKLFSDNDENSYGSKMVDCFKDSAVQQLASQATEGNGIGLANILYEQMKRQYGVQSADSKGLDSEKVDSE